MEIYKAIIYNLDGSILHTFELNEQVLKINAVGNIVRTILPDNVSVEYTGFPFVVYIQN